MLRVLQKLNRRKLLDAGYSALIRFKQNRKKVAIKTGLIALAESREQHNPLAAVGLLHRAPARQATLTPPARQLTLRRSATDHL